MHLSRKLAAYAAGAAAAGLAAAESADAAIIPNTTPKPIGSGATVDIDFEGNNVPEYQVLHGTQSATDPTRLLLKDSPSDTTTNSYLRTTPNVPTALTAGTIIGPSLNFGSEYAATLRNANGTGQWTPDNIDGNPQYVGVKFKLDVAGPEYFGWIGVDITDPVNLTGKVTGFAYEDTGGPIAAGAVPEPTGLALLALGAPFLLRRRRS